jgi:pilus assembly protein CpaB
VTQLTRRNVLLLAAVMAAATTFVAYLFLTRQQVSARSRDERNAVQTMVVVPRQEIRPLQLLRPEWFAVKQVKMDGVPRDAVATPADLKGKVALVTMAPGQYVTESQVAAKGPELGLAYTVVPPYRAITVALDPIIGVAGFPKPGNHVDVLATFTTDYGMVTRTVLQDIEILALGSEPQSKAVDPNSGKTSDARTQPTATLSVLPGEAERLILAEKRGTLRLALRSVEDTTYRGHTGATEKTVTGYTPQPKNPIIPTTVTKTAPETAKLNPTAERYINDADRLVREMTKHPAAFMQQTPPPVLPPASGYTPASAEPPVRPDGPDHVITVLHGTTVEKAKIQHPAKRGAAEVSPSAETESVPVTEAR